MGQAMDLAVVAVATIHFATGDAISFAVSKLLPEYPLLLK